MIAVAAIVAAANTTDGPWPVTAVLGIGGVLAAVLLVVRERRTTSPLVPTGLWRRGFVGGLAGSFGITATTSSFVVVDTIYLQDAKGFSPAAAGLMILPFSVAVVLAAAVAGRLMPRVGPRRILVLGLVLILSGAAAVILWSAIPALVFGLVLAGLGNGMGAVAAYGLGTAVPAEQQGSAAGLLNTAAQVGTATMVAITLALATRGAGVNYRAGWLAVVVTALAITCAVLAAIRRSPREPIPTD